MKNANNKLNKKSVYLENIFISGIRVKINIYIIQKDLQIDKKEKKQKKTFKVYEQTVYIAKKKIQSAKNNERMLKFTSSLTNGNYNKMRYYFMPHESGRSKQKL